ncbi:MAG: hypothetical protein ACFCUR_07815 [Rhodomicrobiaceae bacterium]
MQTGALVLIEIILIFGAVLALGAWELRSLRKARQARQARERAAREAEDQDVR